MMLPHFKHLFLELPRTIKTVFNMWCTEFSYTTSPTNSNIIIVVYPGFLMSDWSTSTLRSYLTHKGYIVYGWEETINKEFSLTNVQKLYNKITELHAKHNKDVVLIGWSLGGIYAREIGRYHPNVVKIVTIASPFMDLFSNYLVQLYKMVSNNSTTHLQQLNKITKQSLTKSSLNIYSKNDGIVDFHACYNENDTNSIQVEVHSSHTGMGFDINTLQAIYKYIDS